jgi:hypothetical protein
VIAANPGQIVGKILHWRRSAASATEVKGLKDEAETYRVFG